MVSERLLAYLGQHRGGTLVEIGVARGASAVKFLSLENVVQYIGIDPYILYDRPPSKEFSNGYLDLKMVKIPANEGTIEVLYRECQENLRPYGKRARLIRDFAHEAVKQFDQHVDILYIDGNHQYEYVIRDLNDWWPKISSGGLLVGDDFDFHGGPVTGRYGGRAASEVDRAARDFCRDQDLELDVIDGNFVICRP